VSNHAYTSLPHLRPHTISLLAGIRSRALAFLRKTPWQISNHRLLSSSLGLFSLAQRQTQPPWVARTCHVSQPVLVVCSLLLAGEDVESPGDPLQAHHVVPIGGDVDAIYDLLIHIFPLLLALSLVLMLLLKHFSL